MAVKPKPKTQNKIGFYTKLDPQLREAVRQFKTATGVSEASQVAAALRAYHAAAAQAAEKRP